MAECPACGRGVPSGAETCPECGARLTGITESFPPLDAGLEAGHEHLEAGGPVLVVRKGPDVGERFWIDRPRLTLGRDPGSDIFLNDVTVSRHHAVIEQSGTEVAIRDVGSLNGTYVNGVCVDSARLSSGDVLQVGAFQMVYAMGGGS